MTPPTQCTVKPPIKDTPKEDKPPNKKQAESTRVYTLYRQSPLKEDNLSTIKGHKSAGPPGFSYAKNDINMRRL